MRRPIVVVLAVGVLALLCGAVVDKLAHSQLTPPPKIVVK